MKIKDLLQESDALITDEDAAIAWVIENLKAKDLKIDKNHLEFHDGVIDCFDGSVGIITIPETVTRLRVQFGKVKYFVVKSSMETCVGFPKEVPGSLRIEGRIKSFEGFTEKIHILSIATCPNWSTTLKGINKVVKECSMFVIANTVKNGLLDLAKIKSASQIFCDDGNGSFDTNESRPIVRVADIIAQMLGDNSIVKIQRALIDADLEEFE